MQSDSRLSLLEPCAPEPASVAAAPLRRGAGSLAEADKREFIVASVLSKRITELERVLGMPLLLRQARGVEPTSAGRVLALGARTLLQKAIDPEVNVRNFATGWALGHVRVAAHLSAITQFLSADLINFTEGYPRFQIDLEERIGSSVTRMVLDNVADIGVFICLNTRARYVQATA